MVKRAEQSLYWKNKSDIKAIESYFISPPATKRSLWFVEQLKDFEFDSIFEVGYFAGRNLKYIKESFPNVKIGGLEINPKAANFARNKLSMPHLKCMDLHDIDNMDERYDIVFTSGVLIHLVPSDIDEVLKKLLNRSNKYVMHIEENGKNHVVAGPKKMNPSYKVSDQVQYAPNLISAYNSLGFCPETIDLPKDVRTNGAKELLIIRL